MALELALELTLELALETARAIELFPEKIRSGFAFGSTRLRDGKLSPGLIAILIGFLKLNVDF